MSGISADNGITGATTKRTIGQPINVWWRVASTLLALAGLASGGIATFVTHVEAGPVALITAGLILLLVAISGRMPRALRYGEAEARFEEETVRDFVTQAAAEISTEETPEFVNALGNLASVAPRAAAAGLSAVSSRASYEQLVKTLLMDIASELPPAQVAEASTETTSLRQIGVDFQIRYNDRLVLADIRYREKPIAALTAREAWFQAHTAGDLVAGTPTVEMLLITNQPLSKGARDQMDSLRSVVSGSLVHVLVRDASDAPNLELAVRRALGLSN